jgi:hypothetical protein
VFVLCKRLARDKYSSLLQKSVNYGCKGFYSTGPWWFNQAFIGLSGSFVWIVKSLIWLVLDGADNGLNIKLIFLVIVSFLFCTLSFLRKDFRGKYVWKKLRIPQNFKEKAIRFKWFEQKFFKWFGSTTLNRNVTKQRTLRHVMIIALARSINYNPRDVICVFIGILQFVAYLYHCNNVYSKKAT